MTVKDLIEQLTQFDKHFEVRIRECDWSLHEVNPKITVAIKEDKSTLVVIECKQDNGLNG